MLNNFSIRLVKHSELSDALINQVIALKQQHWPYSYESQIDWLNENLSQNDYHLLITDTGGNLIAYMNLVNRRVNNEPILGIGNVCVNKDVLDNGVGTLLMHICKYYAKQLSLNLVLLCKQDLVCFYNKCGFLKYENKVYIEDTFFDKCVMFSNCDYNLEKVIYINNNF
ncbi:MAG: putative acyltransferase [Firmicutes bacterium]|nr:putative acyltransferase [Bacillota bacterium]